MTGYSGLRFLFAACPALPVAGRIGAAQRISAASPRSSRRVLVCCFSLLLSCVPATGQSRTGQDAEATLATADNLSARLKVAMEARQSGDLGAISLASERVIALGLVDMAKLRLDERAFEDAAKLCRESLEFEDTPETRVELAIVSLYAKKPADAIEQASLAAERAPRNALAWNIKGEALLQSKDFAGAATALSRSLEIKQDAESIYALSIAHLGMGERQEARAGFAHLLTLTGEYGWSRALVGQAYQEAGMPAEAEAEFHSALQLDPRTPNAHYYWALTLLRSNAWDPTSESKSHLQEELKLNPRHFLANYLLGFFASNERKYDESDRYLELAAKLDPSLPDVWLYLGLNAHERGANRLAETYFRRAITLTKNDSSIKSFSIRKAYFGLGRILLSTGRTKESEEMFQKARELQRRMAQKNAGNGAGVSEAAVPYLPETDRQNSVAAASGQALTSGEESRTVSPKTSIALQSPSGKPKEHLRTILGSSFNDLATAEALQEKYDLAFKHYREAEKWDSGIPSLQRNLGLAAFFVGENAEAIRLLAKAIVTSPEDAHARAVLGLAYFATQNYRKAAQTISPIADRAVQDPQLGLAWAKSLSETGDKIGAARALDSLEKANPSMTADNLIQVGQLWVGLSETKRAEQAFRRALLADPANADAKCALGIALMRLSKPNEAADLFLSVLADHPDHPEALFQLGRASFELGNLPEAIRYLEEAARVQPAKLPIHLALETAYRKAGRTSDADRERVLCEGLKNRPRTARSTP